MDDDNSDDRLLQNHIIDVRIVDVICSTVEFSIIECSIVDRSVLVFTHSATASDQSITKNVDGRFTGLELYDQTSIEMMNRWNRNDAYRFTRSRYRELSPRFLTNLQIV